MATSHRWLAVALFIYGLDVQAQTAKGKSPVDNSSSILFPDWGAESFDFAIGPILGLRARQTEVNGVEADVVSSEIGLGARIHGIPLAPGNPGATVQPYAHFTWGNRTEKLKSATLTETATSGFQRNWYGVLSRVYVKAFRYSLDLGQGQINHDKDFFVDVNSRRVMNDFAVLILPFFSTHYTLTWLTVTPGSESKPSIEELDHWLHGRVAFSFLDFNLDFGPGMSTSTYSGRSTPEAPFKEIASISSSYLKALASLHLFWRLGASGSMKYVYAGKKKNGLDEAIEQLPNESLAQRKTLSNLPDGSLEASAFFGLSNVLGGFGVGWQYYYLEEKGNPTQISRDQGIAIVYASDI